MERDEDPACSGEVDPPATRSVSSAGAAHAASANRATRSTRAVLGTLGAVAELVVPRWCAGCGRSGESLCGACAAEFRHWFRADVDAPLLDAGPVTWSMAGYRDRVARIVMAWKSGARPDLAGPMAVIGREAGRRLAREAGPEIRPLARTHGIVLVPAPSGWRRRWRGREVVAPWAAAVAEGLAGQVGSTVRVDRALVRSGGRAHRLSATDRRRERDHAIALRHAARPGRGDGPGEGVVLVDDVLTTGATLSACARALAGRGEVLAALTLAATPSPRRRTDLRSIM